MVVAVLALDLVNGWIHDQDAGRKSGVTQSAFDALQSSMNDRGDLERTSNCSMRSAWEQCCRRWSSS